MLLSSPRPSLPRKTLDENAYAVRVRILTPENGLRCLGELHVWLREKTQSNYTLHFESANSRLYVNDAAVAAQCIKKFGLELSGMPKHPI